MYTFLQQGHSQGYFSSFGGKEEKLSLSDSIVTDYLMKYSHLSHLVAKQISVLHLSHVLGS